MEYLKEAAFTLSAIPIAWMFRCLLNKISKKERWLWIVFTALLVALFFLSTTLLYSLEIAKEWHRCIQLSVILSAFYAYQRIEPLPANFKKVDSDVNANIERYREYQKSRKENKKWWQLWL